MDAIFSQGVTPQLKKYLPNFSDFQCTETPPVSNVDKTVGHICAPASNTWLAFMREIVFKTMQTSPILGAGTKCGYDFGLALPNDQPINGKWLSIDATFACRYMGRDPVTIHDLNKNNVLLGLKSIALLLNTASVNDRKRITQGNLFQCCCAIIHEDQMHTLIQYVDFTMCPLIERIRRYYRNVLNNNIFSKDRDPETLSSDEKDLRETYKLREVFFAHNMHYPPKPDNPMPIPFHYGYDKGGNMYLKSFFYSIDRSILQKKLEKVVMSILNYGSAQEMENDLAAGFPDLSQKLNGSELAIIRLVRYLAQNTTLEYITKYGFGVHKAKDMPILLELSGATNPQMISEGRAFRDLALHDHFPFEEFYGHEMMHRINISHNGPRPRNMKKAKRIESANKTLVEAALMGERDTLRQKLSEQKNAACGKKRKDGR